MGEYYSLWVKSTIHYGLSTIPIPLLQSEEGCPKGGVVGKKRNPYYYDS